MSSDKKKTHSKILKCFTKQGIVLLKFLMAIPQNMKQPKEQDLKH